MKPKSALRSYLFLAGSSLLALSSLPAATFYWDNNGTATGFGDAGGTWAQNSTSGGTSARWKTDVTGVAAGSATQATSDADIFNFGTATSGLGAGTITVSGSVTMGDTLYGAASGAIVLSGGTINFGAAKTITVNNSTNRIESIIGGAATSLTKAGLGTLLLTGANTYTGTTNVNGGTLDLGGGTANGSLASTALTLGGGTFSDTRTGTNAQSFISGTTINAGASTVTTNNASNTIDVGALTRTAKGGVLNISATGTTTTTTANTNGILGGWAVLDNAGTVTNWAFSTGSGLDITDGVTYDTTSGLLNSGAGYANKNVDVDSSQAPDAAISANSLRFNAGSAQTLTLQGANTLVSGGILVTNTGGNSPTITGGTLAGSASGDLIVHQYQTTNGLAIDSQILDNGGATALTKAGPGLLTLNGNNTFTGGVFIHGGHLALGNAGALNSTTPNNVTFGAGYTGTLSLGGNNLTIPVLSGGTASAASVIENAGGTNATLTINSSSNSSFPGVIQNGTGGGTMALTKAGSGTLTLNGANTYTGGTTLSAGTVNANNATSFGTGDVTVTGNSRINTSGGNITYANNLIVNASQTLTMQNPAITATMATFNGVLSGSGTIFLPNSGTNGIQGILDFTNTANSFTGSVSSLSIGSGDEHFRFASLGDGGTFTFAKNGNRQLITRNGSSNINFTSRTITIASTMVNGGTTDRQGLDGGGSNPVSMFANDGTGTVSFTQNMVVNNITSAYGVLYFGGTNAGNNTFGGDIGDTSGASQLSIGKFGSGKWIFTGSNTYQGNTLIGGGTLSVSTIANANVAQPLGIGAGIQLGVSAAGTLEYTGGTASTNKQIVIGAPINQNANVSAGSILNNGSGALTFTNGTFNPTSASYIAPGGSTPTGTAVTATRTLTLGGTYAGAANEIQGVIQNNAAAGVVNLAKSGAGTWKLSGPNTYTGGTAISGGTLDVANVSGLGASGTLSINAASTTRLSTDTAFGGSNPVYNVQMTNPGSYAGTIELNRATPGAVTGITHNFGTLLITLNGGGAATLNVTAGVNAPTGGALDTIAFTSMSAGNNNTVTETLNPTGGKITIGNLTAFGNQLVTMALSGTTTGNAITGVIGGTGNQNLVAITKTNSSTWTLSGANTYSGSTSVNSGTLALSSTGSIATSASVTIGAGATLDTDAQATYVIPALQPLTFGINPAGSGSSGKIAADGLDITNAVVTLNPVETLDDPVYVLATYTAGSLTGTAFAAPLPTLPSGYELDYDYQGNKIALVEIGGNTFASWISGFAVGGLNGVNDDPDFDGIDNGMEMVLGGNPATGMDTALLPTIELVTNPVSVPAIPAGNYLLFTYRRSDLSAAAGVTADCETDTDFVGPWTAATGAPGVVIQVDDNYASFTPPAANTDRVRVYVPRGANTKLFGRLNVKVP